MSFTEDEEVLEQFKIFCELNDDLQKELKIDIPSKSKIRKILETMIEVLK